MKEYVIAINGAQGLGEWLVLRLIGDGAYQTIATCKNRDNAQEIVDALTPQPEQRLGWGDLDAIAAQRGR